MHFFLQMYIKSLVPGTAIRRNISIFVALIIKKQFVMSKLVQIWEIVRHHKYLITVGAFLLIIGVLDENSLLRRVQHWREISSLKAEIQMYRDQYEKDSRTLKELTTHPEELEKVAREKYLMKKANEDIFVFEEDLDASVRKERVKEQAYED